MLFFDYDFLFVVFLGDINKYWVCKWFKEMYSKLLLCVIDYVKVF